MHPSTTTSSPVSTSNRRRAARQRNHVCNSTTRDTSPHGTSTSVGSLAVVCVISLLASANLIDVYGSAALWSRAALPATCCGAVIAWAGIRPSLRLWWQLVLMAVAQTILGPIIALPETTYVHILPSAETLARGWEMTFGAFKVLIAVPPPVGAVDGALMAVWTLTLWMTFLAGTIAMLPNANHAVIAMLPLLVGFMVAALLGTSAGFCRIGSGVAAAVLAVAWASWRRRQWNPQQWLGACGMVAAAAAVAVCGGMIAGQHRVILREWYEPPPFLDEMVSPLSGMRAYVSDHRDDVLFTAAGLPEGTPIRLAVMDSFDGTVWNRSDSGGPTGASEYRRIGTRISRRAAHPSSADHAAAPAAAASASGTGTPFTAIFTITQDLADQWLPLAGAATAITFDDADDMRRLYYGTESDTGLLAGGINAGTTYTEHGIIAPTPTDGQLAQAEAMPVTQPAPRQVPDSVGAMATSIAGGQPTAGAAAQALATTLSTLGWFSHGLAGDYPSPAGHGSYRIGLMTSGTVMVGNSEQYASAMALMARELGLPSRVVLGFVHKRGQSDGGQHDNQHGNQPDKRRSDRGTVTEFTGNDIEAWVEINLAGYGWVAFYPTPDESKTPDDQVNLSPPDPEPLVRQPPPPLADPPREDTRPRGRSAISGEDAEPPPGDSLWSWIGVAVRAIVVYGSPIWIPALCCAIILIGKMLRLLWMRRHGPPRRRVVQGWHALVMLAADLGLDPGGTRRDQTRHIIRHLHLGTSNAESLTRLAREADHAAFGRPASPGNTGSADTATIDDDFAERYWIQVDELRDTLLAALPRTRRWKARLSLRFLRCPTPSNFGGCRCRPNAALVVKPSNACTTSVSSAGSGSRP